MKEKILEHLKKAKGEKVPERKNINSEPLIEDTYILTNIDELGINGSALNGRKDYDIVGNKVASSYIQIEEISSESIEKMLCILKTKVYEESLKMWVFIVYNINKETTTIYQLNTINETITVADELLARDEYIMDRIAKKLTNN